MSTEVKLNEVREVLDGLDYPLSRAAARDALDGVRLLYADGEEPLSDVVGRAAEDAFDSAESLEAAVFSNLPTEAVGEPGQSEGEG